MHLHRFATIDASAPSTGSTRIVSVDLLRGLVMMLMALDHTSAPGTSSLAPFPLITPAGESNVRVKVARPDSSIRNDIPYYGLGQNPKVVCSRFAPTPA